MNISQFCGVKNQYLYVDDSGNRILQSYNSVIAKIDDKGNTYLDSKYWNYSKTTSTYRNKFLGLSSKKTEQRIKAGTIKLVNLNG